MKQERYLNDDGTDWIDECAATLTPEEFRGAMKFTIGKYKKRMGKKDDVELEQSKIDDYEKRWMEHERKQSIAILYQLLNTDRNN
jgi:hypothetical protein